MIAMRTVGVIVEYNPFHNGHHYHLQQAKEVSSAQAVVAVMSGYFLQRGEPALIDKWSRAEMALRGGADLVLELPVLYACQPAEWFAFGAVATLEATGIVDALCFGSESGNLNWMRELTSTLVQEPPSFKVMLQRYLKQGWSYPKAYSHTLQHFHPDLQHTLTKPNNILGLSYLAALHKINSPITPYTIRREKAGYHDARPSDKRIASATAIRNKWVEVGDVDLIEPYVPATTYRILKTSIERGVQPITWESLHQALIAKLISESSEQLSQYYGVVEGLEYRLKQQLPHAKTVQSYVDAIKTKRYTWNRVQRILTYILLGLRQSDVDQHVLAKGPTYLRVLGFNEHGRKLLKKMKKTAKQPVVTRIKQQRPSMLDWDLRAAAMYALATEWKVPYKEEFDRAPVDVSTGDRDLG